MGFLEELKESKFIPNKYVIEHSLIPIDNIVCFVEGKDQPYYSYAIKRINDEIKTYFYPCGGKSNVENTKKFIFDYDIDKEHKKLFFCDTDYGLETKIEDIFYTDSYSVENYYTGHVFFISILENIFNYNMLDSNYKKCLDLFNRVYSLYSIEIKKINAFCYAVRLLEKKKTIKRSVFSDKILKSIIDADNINECELNTVQFKSLTFEIIKDIIEPNIIPTKKLYRDCLRIIDEKKFRGKWELEFIVFFFEKIRKARSDGKYGLTIDRQKIISFNNEIMVSMSQYANRSTSLNDYIINHI